MRIASESIRGPAEGQRASSELGSLRSWMEEHSKQWSESISHELRDPLTGLRNRNFAEQTIGKWYERPEPCIASVGYIDIDQLKTFNEKNSQTSGDLLIKAVGQRIECRLAHVAYVSRVAAGRYLVLFPYLAAEDARFPLEDVRKEISYGRIEVDDSSHELTLSASLMSVAGHDAEEIFQKVEEGLFHAKSQGRNCGYFYHENAWAALDELARPAKPAAEEKPAADESESFDEPPTNLESVPETKQDIVSEEAKVETASSDDIEALFAAAKAQGAPAAAPEPPKPAAVPAPAPMKEEELATRASGDDIEALFAAAQAQTQKPAAEAKPSVAEATLELKKAEIAQGELDEEESAEMASSDDIEALFAAVKETSSTVNDAIQAPKISETERAAEEEKKEIKDLLDKLDAPPEPPSNIDLSESASADDIAALFAAMK